MSVARVEAAVAVCAIIFIFVGCAADPWDRERLKLELKREIIAELKTQGRLRGEEAPSAPVPPPVVKSGEQAPAPVDPPKVVNKTPANREGGSLVSGSLLYDGKGLPACRVRLVKMSVVESMFGVFPSYREEEAVIEATTNQDGSYAFQNVSEGLYRLKWQPTGENGWIRRSHEKPDVEVVEGKETTLKAIETHKLVIGAD